MAGFPVSLFVLLALVFFVGDFASALSVPSEVASFRSPHIAEKISVALEANQSLMICNAYAYKEPISVSRVRGDVRVTEKPIGYKDCQNVFVGLQEADRLDFKAGSLNIGAFFTTGLPKVATTLLLVPHRRDGSTMAVSFESHAFMDLATAQVAVVDAYRGHEAAIIRITDNEQKATADTALNGVAALQVVRRTEDLKFSSVVALTPGSYQVQLTSTAGEAVAPLASPVEVGVMEKVNYVAMRVGIDDPDSTSKYPQELVVFPRTTLPAKEMPGVLGSMFSGFFSLVGMA